MSDGGKGINDLLAAEEEANQIIRAAREGKCRRDVMRRDAAVCAMRSW